MTAATISQQPETSNQQPTSPPILARVERAVILAMMVGRTRTEAAGLLGISARTLHERLRAYGYADRRKVQQPSAADARFVVELLGGQIGGASSEELQQVVADFRGKLETKTAALRWLQAENERLQRQLDALRDQSDRINALEASLQASRQQIDGQQQTLCAYRRTLQQIHDDQAATEQLRRLADLPRRCAPLLPWPALTPTERQQRLAAGTVTPGVTTALATTHE